MTARDPGRPHPAIRELDRLLYWRAFGRSRGDVNWTDSACGLRNNLSNAGVLGGAQLGFNYQFNSIVLGFEGFPGYEPKHLR
jgi:hypothetical protein